jgi:hypothetical protein
MVVVAIYCTKVKPLDINQCWTFSLYFTVGLFVLLRIVCRKAGSAFKGHLLISFLAFAYLGISYFGLEQQFPKQYAKLHLPENITQKLSP